MERKEVVEKVNEVLLEQMCLDNAPKETDSLTDDLGFDSLDAVELIMELESKFSVKIADEDVPDMKTVSDVVELVIKHQ